MNDHQTRDYTLLGLFFLSFIGFLFALAGKLSFIAGGILFLLSILSFLLLAQTVATSSIAIALGALFFVAILFAFLVLKDAKGWVIFATFLYALGCMLGHLACMRYQNITIKYDVLGSAKKIGRFIVLGACAFIGVYVWVSMSSLEKDGKVDSAALYSYVSSGINKTNDIIKTTMKKDKTILDISADELLSSDNINIGKIMGISSSSPAASNPQVKKAVADAQSQLKTTLVEQVYTLASVPKDKWSEALYTRDLAAYKLSALFSEHFLLAKYELTVFLTLSSFLCLSIAMGLLSALSAVVLRLLLQTGIYEFRNGYIEKQYLE